MGRPANHSSCHKTRVNDLSFRIRMQAQLSFVFSQITHLTDGQTERQTRHTEFSSLDRVCIPCSAVKSEAVIGRSVNGAAQDFLRSERNYRHI